MFALSSHPDLREERKRAILRSLPLLYLLSLWNVFSWIAIVILAFLWHSILSWHFARIFTASMFGTGRAGGSFRPEYHMVRHFLKIGDPVQAQRALNEELEKDPLNYEGLLLQAQLHLDLKKHALAVKDLEKILSNPVATDAQKEIARSEKQRIEFEFAPAAAGDSAPPPKTQS